MSIKRVVDKVVNWEGKMVTPPKDLRLIIADHDNKFISWSANSQRYQVRFGLQVKTFPLTENGRLCAAHEFGECVAVNHELNS